MTTIKHLFSKKPNKLHLRTSLLSLTIVGIRRFCTPAFTASINASLHLETDIFVFI